MFRWHYAAAALVILSLGAVFGCCIGAVGTCFIPRSPKDAVGKIAAEPTDDMTFQQLEDRLKILKICRHAIRRNPDAMLFGPTTNNIDGDFSAFDENFHADADYVYGARNFLVTKYPNAKEAKAAARAFVDIKQKPAFAWGRFTFKSSRETLDIVQATLNADTTAAQRYEKLGDEWKKWREEQRPKPLPEPLPDQP